MCKNLVDEMVVLGKEGWLVEKWKEGMSRR
jgi:hypothetical protein